MRGLQVSPYAQESPPKARAHRFFPQPVQHFHQYILQLTNLFSYSRQLLKVSLDRTSVISQRSSEENAGTLLGRNIFRDWFEIDVCAAIKGTEIAKVNWITYQRHIYEHNGGEVDRILTIGVRAVRLKQVIDDTQEGTHTHLG